MKYIFDSYALQYMLEDFPKQAVPELYQIFCDLCDNGTVISERETRKKLEVETVEIETIEWCNKNSDFFKPLTEADSIHLSRLMSENKFDFFDSDLLAIRRFPEGLPFILSMAQSQDRCFVYRKNKGKDTMHRILKICKECNIKFAEVDEFLSQCRNISTT